MYRLRNLRHGPNSCYTFCARLVTVKGLSVTSKSSFERIALIMGLRVHDEYFALKYCVQ